MRTETAVMKPVHKNPLKELMQHVEEKVVAATVGSRIVCAVNLLTMEKWRRSALARRGFFYNQ